MNIMAKIFYPVLCAAFLVSGTAHSAEYDSVITLPPAQVLSLPVSAMIKSVTVKAGQKIKQGDAIVALDQTPFVAARADAKASVAVHESRLKEAKRDLEHHQELYDRTVLSKVDLENVEMRERRERALLAEAKAKLEIAEYNLSYSKLNSPYDAVVLLVHVNTGQYLNSTQQSRPLVSLVRQGHYQAQFSVAAGEYSSIDVDDRVSIEYLGGSYQGKISSIDYQSISDGKIKVTADFDNKEWILPGNKAVVRIE